MRWRGRVFSDVRERWTANPSSVAEPSLLGPIGDFRSANANRSKGKRARKRKREADRSILKAEPSQRSACPELVKSVTIGFNSTTRYLETLAQKSAPSSLAMNISDPVLPGKRSTSGRMSHYNAPISEQNTLFAVFVPNRGESSNLYSHLPILVKAASMAFPHLPEIRLVTLPSDAEARLSKALQLPRVGLIGLKCDAPGSSVIAEVIRADVPEVVVPWLQESQVGVYMPTEINVVHSNSCSDQSKVAKKNSPSSRHA